jgi:hypothetical protein
MFSWTFGPVGTVGAAGAGLRMEATIVQTKVLLSRSQSQGSPVVALRRSVPVIILDRPVAVSATHSSIPFVLVFKKERCDPSGEK